MTSFTRDDTRLAEIYERESELQFESGKRLMARLELDSSARVLDVGCGTGRLTRWLASQLGTSSRVVGIDPIEPRIAIARSHDSAATFEPGRAEALHAFGDASFDAVCLSSVLHWVSDKKLAFAELHRVLRPRGRVAVTTLAQELSATTTVGRVFRSLLQRAPYAGHIASTRRASTLTELVTLVLESGLELLELHVTPTLSEHENGEAFVAFAEASAFGNLLDAVPEALRASLRRELVEAFGANRVVIHGSTVEFVARKP